MIFPRNRFPFTSYTEINLDWILRKLREVAPAGADNPVSYDAQSPTAAEQAQARDNIGIDYPVTSVNTQTGDVTIPEVPAGGLTGYALVKLSDDDYDVDWAAITSAVTSVNGQTGAVTITVPTKTSDLVNDSGFITSAPVTSVNGQTGAVTVTVPTKTSDLVNDSGFITSAPVTSVNSQTGDVTLTPASLGAMPIVHAPNALTTGTNYDLTGYGVNDFMILVCSPNGANNNTIYYVNLTYQQVRLLGNTASAITISLLDSILTITSGTYQANIFICPLPPIG